MARDVPPEMRGVLARYSAILEAVTASGSGLSLTEIMRATNLSSGTTHRLVNSLVDVGYLVVQSTRKTYHVGPRLLRLFHLAHSRANFSTLVEPVLRRLVARFGETAFVAKLAGHQVESVAFAVPEDYSQAYVQPGRVMPINAAASAKAIFAYQPPHVIAKALKAPLRKYTKKTITDPSMLIRHLKKVRDQGFAVCADELDPGVLSFACPIALSGAGALYSVGLVGLSKRLARFKERDVVAALNETAESIAMRLAAELKVSSSA